MITGKRLWRTNDGDLVPDGHPDAAFLAYGPGDQVPDDVAEGLKLKAPTENKMQLPAENKGSGLIVDTIDSLRRQAEDLGIKVDKRWGADTLRREIDAARAQVTAEPTVEGASDEEE